MPRRSLDAVGTDRVAASVAGPLASTRGGPTHPVSNSPAHRDDRRGREPERVRSSERQRRCGSTSAAIELEVVEVAQVDELQVHPVGAEVAQAQELLDRGLGRARDVDLGERVGVGPDRGEAPQVVRVVGGDDRGQRDRRAQRRGVAPDLLAGASHAVERLGDDVLRAEADVELGREPSRERGRALRSGAADDDGHRGPARASAAPGHPASV